MATAVGDGQPVVRDFAFETNTKTTTTPLKDSFTDKQTTPNGTTHMNTAPGTATMDRQIASDKEESQDKQKTQAEAILRQVEFYFSDDNLRRDAHLLGLIKAGNGTVRLSEIMRFKKMREFKPKTAVIEALKQSSLVEVTGNGKLLRRKIPLCKPITVTPRVFPITAASTILEDKPWLTKGMLKPTGFEPYIADGPIKPAEFAQDLEDYNPEISFTHRIETAVARFTAKRKMHRETRQIFSRFMIYGGMDAGQKMFTGPVDTEGLTKKEIADLSSEYAVSERVTDGFDRLDPNECTWVVDFEATAKGFLSSQFLSMAAWYATTRIMTATNVLRNFYNYLLHHDVCKEYTDQLYAARKVCDLAEKELPDLAIVDQSLAGGFNIACSVLFGGKYASTQAGVGDWATDSEDLNWSKGEAKKVFCAGVAAYGSDELLEVAEDVVLHDKPVKVISEEELGLEVVSVELVTNEAKEVYEDPRLANTLVKPMGRIHCKLWDVPSASPVDLPPHPRKTPKDRTFTFLLDGDTLKHCFVGLKMEACVVEVDIGVKWIDYVQTTYPSFHTWLVNETIRDWKEPGPPRDWMARQARSEDGTVAVRDGEDGVDEDGPD